MKISNLAIVLFISLVVSGCGGGSDSPDGGNSQNPSSTNPGVEFKLFPDNYFTSYDETVSLTGSDNNGFTYTGSFMEKTTGQQMFLGETSIDIETVIDFSISNGGFGTATLNYHYSESESDRRLLGVSGDVVTASSSPTVVPQTAAIGDSGVIGSYTDNSGWVTEQSWQLEDGGNGNGRLVITSNGFDQSGALDNTFTTTYIIQPDGTRLSVELVTFNINVNIEVTLSGDY